MLHDYAISVIRTAVPAGVGAVVAYLAARGLNVPADVVAQATALGSFAATALYYAIVRALETRWPAVGRLLGKKAAPTYPAQP